MLEGFTCSAQFGFVKLDKKYLMHGSFFQIMLFVRVLKEGYDIKESMVYPDTYDCFNHWPELLVKKRNHIFIPLGIKTIAGLGERLVLTDRYGFCVSNGMEVRNQALMDDIPICIKITNNSSNDIIIPDGAILCQIMVLQMEMVGR